MLIRDDRFQTAFENRLKTHTHVDIATAWASGGEHLRVLANAARRKPRGVRVRAIVGIAGKATHPDALTELYGITEGDLRIIGDEGRLFHPKLYLFHRLTNRGVRTCAWIGSANFTAKGFGVYDRANEEIIVEIGPGEYADRLAEWFRERWERCAAAAPVADVIRRYTKAWHRDPPSRDVRKLVSESVSERIQLLDDAHRPQTFVEYHQALRECEEMLEDEEWEVLNPQGRSYMRAISVRRRLLLGETSWRLLDHESQKTLKGSWRRPGSDWWGLLGRMGRSNWPVVREHETRIRAVLDEVVGADSGDFPDVAVKAMQELIGIENNLGYGTATLLLTLARPDRLLSLNNASKKGLSTLSGTSRSTLGTPENYRLLLQWLYSQPWFTDRPPTDEDSAHIWQFRAALVDAFAYKRP